MKSYITTLILIITSFIFISCGEEAGSPPKNDVQGSMVYGSVEGMTLVCSSGLTAYTDENGSFSCKKGDSVAFYIGSTAVSTINAKNGNTTPYDLFADDQEAALNYTRLLEALNSEINSSDGSITIDAKLAQALPTDVDFSSENFEQDIESELNVTLISEREAQEKLNAAMLDAGEEIPKGSNIPVADAGNDINTTQVEVSLDGSKSFDLDGDVLTYSWTLKEKPNASQLVFDPDTRIHPKFTPDTSGVYLFVLRVHDGKYESALDEILVTVAEAPNNAPTADAGSDQNVSTLSFVTLNAGGSDDLDGDSLSYTWSITSKPVSSGISLQNANTQVSSFTPDLDGEYVLSLVVYDGTVYSAPDSVKIIATTPNHAPTADAGSDQEIPTLSVGILDSSLSEDADDDILSFVWSITDKPVGSIATLSNELSANPNFFADVDGNYTFTLYVNDGEYNSGIDSVTFTAVTGNSAPVADAGKNQNVETNSSVSLDGIGSTDVDGNSLTYLWSFNTQPLGSTALLQNDMQRVASFTPDLDGEYNLSLVVNDGTVDSLMDEIIITASTINSAPVADAGINRDVSTGSVVSLDASLSSDANGDVLTFSWVVNKKPSGATVTLSDDTSVAPYFTAYLDGLYEFNLTVYDGDLYSDVAQVSITATTDNVAPVADAGNNQNVATLSTVILDGNASYDANDGDTLTYVWTLTERPPSSSALLSGADTISPSFSADKDGDYVAQLIVYDGSLYSDPVNVIVTASTANSAPVANAGDDATVYINQNHELNSSLSSDANGDALSYAWTVYSQPVNSSVSISDANASHPSFSADTSGTYIIHLRVYDGEFYSEISSVSITEIALDLIPVTAQYVIYALNDDAQYRNIVGVARNYTRSAEVVTDNNSGMMWQDDSPSSLTTYSAAQADQYCSDLVLNSYDDWRVPTIRELLTIVYRDRYGPAIDYNIFQSMYYYRFFWSSTTGSNSTRRVADFYNGIDSWQSPNQGYYVRCVRNSSSTTPLIRDDVNNVVIDTQSKLIWQDDTTASQRDWADAIDYCEGLSLNGSDAWRLPNINELMSVIDFDNTSGIFSGVFHENPHNAWSSTTSSYNTNKAFSVIQEKPFLSLTYEKPFVSDSVDKDYFTSSNDKVPKCVMSQP